MAVIKQFSGGKILLRAPKASRVFSDNIIHFRIHTERYTRPQHAQTRKRSHENRDVYNFGGREGGLCPNQKCSSLKLKCRLSHHT